jgi:hypothetical protein
MAVGFAAGGQRNHPVVEPLAASPSGFSLLWFGLATKRPARSRYDTSDCSACL